MRQPSIEYVSAETNGNPALLPQTGHDMVVVYSTNHQDFDKDNL